MATPLLSISTLAPDRPLVDIDGQFYELRARSDLGIVHFVQLEALMAQYGKLIEFVNAGGEPTETDAAGLELAMDRLCRIFLTAPEDVQDRLNSQNRLAILQAFSEASKENAPPPTPTNRASRRTSAKSSRPSSASTAANRAPGSPSKSPSSGLSVA